MSKMISINKQGVKDGENAVITLNIARLASGTKNRPTDLCLQK